MNDIGFPSECVEWPYRSDKDGYGIFTGAGKSHFTAARLMYQLFVGDVPEGAFVLHRCDNRKCCNPAHLFIGTHEDNMADKIQKKRHLRSDGLGKNTSASEEVVRSIRLGEIDRKKAEEIGVSKSSFYRFRSGSNQKAIIR